MIFPKHNLVLFVHGCFWHRHAGCSKASTPKTRPDFWQAKFDANVIRDARVTADLQNLGWAVETIWECETKVYLQLAERLKAIFIRNP